MVVYRDQWSKMIRAEIAAEITKNMALSNLFDAISVCKLSIRTAQCQCSAGEKVAAGVPAATFSPATGDDSA